MINNNSSSFIFQLCPTKYVFPIINAIGVIYCLLSLPIMILTTIAQVQGGRYWKGVLPQVAQVILPIELVLSFLLAFYGSTLLYLLKKRSPVLIKLIIFSFFLGSALLGVGIAGGTLMEDIFPTDTLGSSCEQQYKKLWDNDEMLIDNTVAQDTFCKQQCPCSVTNSVVQNQISQMQVIQYTNKSNGATSINGCILNQALNQQTLASMIFLENEYSCSGYNIRKKINQNNLFSIKFNRLCRPVRYYIFTNINKGIPTYQSSCYDKVTEFIRVIYQIILYPNMFAGIFLLICWRVLTMCVKQYVKIILQKEEPQLPLENKNTMEKHKQVSLDLQVDRKQSSDLINNDLVRNQSSNLNASQEISFTKGYQFGNNMELQLLDSPTLKKSESNPQ